jgi:hypothetical protein
MFERLKRRDIFPYHDILRSTVEGLKVVTGEMGFESFWIDIDLVQKDPIHSLFGHEHIEALAARFDSDRYRRVLLYELKESLAAARRQLELHRYCEQTGHFRPHIIENREAKEGRIVTLPWAQPGTVFNA